ncbi:esterase B1-like isoform X2 [Coccinella septempunctata]|nr:esterase B1-like isoform X2 [Coccinella septempunctata]XP_044748338.1 esterase B1-like isoform X2 [Coccinella septempunctata]XP_044748339.1 esterase B1-like isoform X2 [Coccinella septempunctata]XP_044748341.1 esterase B1-like isoform X2 [Coccinella septempunctata]
MVEPVVTLSDGPIQGCRRKDIQGEEFLSFEGIPYGEPPVGELRFKDPVPVKPWKEIKDCTKIGSGSLCKQLKVSVDPSTGGLLKDFVLEGSEDCLNLNVYTRQLKNSGSQPKAVMVYIHGGAYVMGNTKHLGPERLITQDIVLVHLHYRLGAFGFLAVDDPKLGVSGNAGMKDQVLALQWVKKNISLFNGDPHNITIFGNSAGGSSVAYLTLSPLGSGLFHKAIIQSSCALNNSIRRRESNAKKLVQALECEQRDEAAILRYLQSLPAEKIYEGQLKCPDIGCPSCFRVFSPGVESKDSKGALLNEEPVELLKSGRYNHVPIMIGYAEMECILFMEYDEKCPFNAVCFEEDTLPPVWFGFEKGSKEFYDMARKIKKFYYGDSEPEYISLETVKMFSDMGITRGMLKTAKYLAETSKQPTFLYRFSIPSNHGEKYSSKNLNGATHGEELAYLFKMSRKTSDEMERHSKRLLKLWTNFAKYGNPTFEKDEVVSIDWKPVTKDNFYYLDIGEELSMKKDPEADRMAFWDQLFQSYPQSRDY